jgi:hypothetical protein
MDPRLEDRVDVLGKGTFYRKADGEAVQKA